MGRLGRALKKVVLVLAFSIPLAAADADPPCRLVVLGDSLVAGYGVDLDQAFPAQLERRLDSKGYGCAVINAGVPGDTTAGGLARLDWVLADRPTHVIVELGANDALRALPVEQMEANLDAILTRLLDQGIELLLAGMLAPPNLGREYGEAYQAAFAALAERHQVAFYPFFLDGVAGEPDLFQADGRHPTADGIAVVVERMLPAVTAWLDS